MRYYDIVLGSASSQLNTLSAQGGHYTSHPSGTGAPPDPGALNVEFDIPVAAGHVVGNGECWIRIWGIGLSDIAQATNLGQFPGQAGLSCTISGGMGVGLPLANPAQSGVLVSGSLSQCYGNWQGTDMTLDMQIINAPGRDVNLPGNAPKAANLVLNWQAKTPLSQALQQTLSTGYPNTQQNINISSNLVLQNNEWAVFRNWTELADYAHSISLKIMNDPNYPGVRLGLYNGQFSAVDGSGTQASPKMIVFTDMVGQVTWVNVATVQATCVMRADIQVNDYIMLPQGQVASGPQSYPGLRQGSVFQGMWLVQQVRHVGNFRSPSGAAWVTTIEAVSVTQSQQQSTTPSTVPSGTETFSDIQITG